MVAPVRETAAQTLGATLKLMPAAAVSTVVGLLLQVYSYGPIWLWPHIVMARYSQYGRGPAAAGI